MGGFQSRVRGVPSEMAEGQENLLLRGMQRRPEDPGSVSEKIAPNPYSDLGSGLGTALGGNLEGVEVGGGLLMGRGG